jgi:hypothetical protein
LEGLAITIENGIVHGGQSLASLIGESNALGFWKKWRGFPECVWVEAHECGGDDVPL